MKLWKLSAAVVLAFALGLGVQACTGAAPPLSTAQSVKVADQVIIRLGELQQTVIDTALSGGMPIADARRVVTWISGDVHASPPAIGVLTVVKAGTQDWQAVLRTGWPPIRTLLANVPKVAPLLPLLDSVIGGLA